MLSAFMFCICTIAFFPLCMVIKKTESKLNGYYVVCISIVVLLGIICCMGGLLSAFDISTSIQTLGGGICVCDIVLLAYIKKGKCKNIIGLQ